MTEERNQRRIWIYYLRFAVAVTLLALLVSWIGFSTVVETLLSMRPLWGVITTFCLLFLFLLGGFNVWIILRTLQPIDFMKFMRSYAYCFAVGLFAPGQLGDATLTIFLRRDGIPLSRSTVAYALDKVVTVMVLLLVGLYGAKLLLPKFSLIWFLALPIIGLVILFIALYSGLVTSIQSPLINRWREWVAAFIKDLQILGGCWYVIVLNMILTIAKWGLLSVCYFAAFAAFGNQVGWPEIAVIPVLSTLVGYIPVSLGGIGTVEVSAVYLFSLQGVNESTVLSAYVILRLMQYLLAGMMFLYFAFRRPYFTAPVENGTSEGKDAKN